jgi:hypothetical protein
LNLKVDFDMNGNERRLRGGGTAADYAAGAAYPGYETCLFPSASSAWAWKEKT